MNLKELMKSMGVQPGQVVSNPYARAFAPQPQVETIVKEEEDHEVSMAQSSLDSIIKAATELKSKIGESEKDIPAWIQDHITNSENYINQAASNYHEYNTNESINESNVINETKFIAFFMGKKIDVEGKDLWDAKQKAILQLKVPKSKLGLLAVVSAESQKNQDFRFESEERPSLTNITRSIVTTPVIGQMVGSKSK